MPTETPSLSGVMAAIGELREELTRLNQRVAQLERPAPTLAPVAREDRIREELVLTISAAVAAYLGVKPHIRHIRLVGGSSWAQLGRATIQASHAIQIHHG